MQEQTPPSDTLPPVGNVEGPPTQDPSQLAQDFKKDELATAAEVQGVEVKSADTKADIAEKLASAPFARGPIRVDNKTRRSDDDALEGSFVKILEGEHAGMIGSFVSVQQSGADGYPTLVLVKLEDTTYTHEFVSEPYSNVRTVRQSLVL